MEEAEHLYDALNAQARSSYLKVKNSFRFGKVQDQPQHFACARMDLCMNQMAIKASAEHANLDALGWFSLRKTFVFL